MSKCLHKLQLLGCGCTLSTRNFSERRNFCAANSKSEEFACIQTKQRTALRGIQKSIKDF